MVFKIFSPNPNDKIKPYQMLLITIIIFFIMATCEGYLEMKVVRIPHETKVYNYGKVQCLTEMPESKGEEKKKDEKKGDDSDDDDDQDSDQQVTESDNFKEVCYEKDISYAIELYNDKKELMLMSLDLTAPISWLKGERCKISQTNKNCSRIEVNFREKVSSIEKKFKDLLSKPFHKQKSKKNKGDEYALIEGSSEVVKGVMEKAKTLTFETRDSGHLTRFLDVFLLGLAIIGIRDTLQLQNTTFINATELSPNLNFLCDGAISLRFDEKSESSFMQEMAVLAQTDQKYVTIFIGEHNQTITIGDLSVKNSAQGLSGIQWVKVSQKQHGKLPHLREFALTYESKQNRRVVSSSLPIVLTLSSSSINIPENELNSIIKKFFKKDSCTVNQETKYLECKNTKAGTMKDGQINFAIQGTDIMIPLLELILEEKKNYVKLNIKQALDERYLILGEPVFRRYFVALDYGHDRIGFSLQRKKFAEQLIDVVILIRFVIWVFLIGCCCILLSNPLTKCWKILGSRNVFPARGGIMAAVERRKLKQYKPIDNENPYDDLKGKIQDIVSDEAEGI